MKRFISLFLVFTLSLSLLSGCSKKKNKTDAEDNNVSALQTDNSSVADETSGTLQDSTSEDKSDNKTETLTKKSSVLTTAKSSESKKIKQCFTSQGKKIIAYFGQENTFDKILDDFSNISFKKPDLKGKKYTTKKEVIKDPEDDDKTVTKYYDGKTLVYETTDTIWDHIIIHYTKTRSGRSAKVSYGVESSLAWVKIESGAHTASYEGFNEKSPYGAERIVITVTKQVKNDIDETLTYCIDNEKELTVECALYYNNGAYKRYTSYVNNDKKLEEYSYDIMKTCTSDVSRDVLKQITTAEEIIILQSLMGPHKLSFKQNGATKKWFITCDLYVVFSDEATAKAFAAKYPAGSPKIDRNYAQDESTVCVLYKNVTMPVSQNLKVSGNRDFQDFAYSEFDDYSFANVEINQNYELTGIRINNSILSCY